MESIAASEKEAGGLLRDSGRKVQEEEWQWKEPEPPSATGFSPTDKRQPFLAWLGGNVGLARWAGPRLDLNSGCTVFVLCSEGAYTLHCECTVPDSVNVLYNNFVCMEHAMFIYNTCHVAVLYPEVTKIYLVEFF